MQYENIDDQVTSTGYLTGMLLAFPIEETAKSLLEVGGNEYVIISPSSSLPFWILTLGRREVCRLWANKPQDRACPPFLLGGQRAGPGVPWRVGLGNTNSPCAQAVEGGEAGASQELPPPPPPTGGRCPVL